MLSWSSGGLFGGAWRNRTRTSQKSNSSAKKVLSSNIQDFLRGEESGSPGHFRPCSPQISIGSGRRLSGLLVARLASINQMAVYIVRWLQIYVLNYRSGHASRASV